MRFTALATTVLLSALLMAFTSVELKTVKIATSAVCEMCKDRIESTLSSLEGVESARLDMTTKKVKVRYDDEVQSEASIRAVITKIGYAADELAPDTEAYHALPGCCQKVGVCEMKTGDEH